MTYQEQLKIEKINKEIIDNIIATVKPEDFINYYIYHSQKETMAKYNIRSIRPLKKILTIFNYDFSKPKPSKFKGKKAARSHESYIAGGKKSAKTQQQRWKVKSAEEKEAWSTKQKEAHATEQFKTKIKQINKDYWASLSTKEKDLIKKQKSIANIDAWKENKTDILAKQYQTKKANKSFNSSKPEESYYNFLTEKFGKDDVVAQYSIDNRYPFNCDYYIKSRDLFIELNFHWSHGGHKFNAKDQNDIAKLTAWQEKAKTSKFYANAIETWTIRDINKYKAAEKNKLNYLVFYTEEDALNYEFN